MTDLYLDDLKVGDAWDGEPFALTEAEIVAFAAQFDPQPIHLDPRAEASARFGGVIASGWHVAARVMRDLVDAKPFGDTPILGVGIEELWWVRPVRPGDILRARREIVEVTPAPERTDGRPRRGMARFKTVVSNQDGDLVMSFRSLIQIPMRPQG
jgi:acyl dehydratase